MLDSVEIWDFLSHVALVTSGGIGGTLITIFKMKDKFVTKEEFKEKRQECQCSMRKACNDIKQKVDKIINDIYVLRS